MKFIKDTVVFAIATVGNKRWGSITSRADVDAVIGPWAGEEMRLCC